ncbi:hypothetical protein C2E23DRAFT_756315 [Lenzites betulinus]|nr:hypothetical protein C2E23DRAFT_756315 [Lenzites betulinus]
MPEESALDKLGNQVPPRRAAARKASKLAAAQLGSSDDENDGGGVTFGEPSTPRSAVKVTYGGKRKYKQSPSVKSSPVPHAGPSRARPRSKSLLEQSPKKTKNEAGRGRGGGASRGRGVQPRAKKTRRRSVSSASSSSSAISEPPSEAEAPKQVTAPSKTRSGAAADGKPTAKATAAGGLTAKEKASKKRPLSTSSSGSAGSLLTPLPSPEMQKSPVMRQMPVLAPRLARQFMRSQSHAEVLIGSKKKNLLKHTKSFDHFFELDESSDDSTVDDYDIGSLVWVSIDSEGNLKDVDAEDADTLWWPAKVSLPVPCMRVSLLGNPPGHKEVGQRQLTIPDPSASNVRTMLHNGRIRFSDADYRPSRRQSLLSSPRKKRKLDVDAAWRDARDLMIRENGGDPSGMQASGQSSNAVKRKPNPFPSLDTNFAKGKGKGKARRKDGDSDDSLSLSDEDDGPAELWKPERLWRAPSANPLLELPGELVLAREGRARTQYWPAKLLDYIKPKSSRQRPRYRALFFDGTIVAIEPDWFWTTNDEEFATCKLGESTGNYGLDSDVDDADDDGNEVVDFDLPFTPSADATLRAPSPLPTLPPPAQEVFEYDLELAEQFEYVKPVLAAALEGTYAPVEPRHEGFMRGAGARQKVLNEVPLRGSLSARDKEELAYLVRAWARRRARRRALGVSVDYPPDKLYPPTGTDKRAPAKAARAAAAGEVNGQDGGADDSDGESVLTPTSDVSGGDTEPLAAFDMEPPPSSFAVTEVETDVGGLAPGCINLYMLTGGPALCQDDERARGVSKDSAAPQDVVNGNKWPSTMQESLGSDDLQLTAQNSAASVDARPEDGVTAAIDPLGAVDKEPVAVESSSQRPSPRRTFYDLDAVEKITYCDNVLLREAILQLLLWRTGQRTVLGLLSPEEEERLHELALEEGEKTDWVHDIIRLRQAAEQTMLPTHKGKGKDKAGVPAPGVRARTRRGA